MTDIRDFITGNWDNFISYFVEQGYSYKDAQDLADEKYAMIEKIIYEEE